MLILYELNRLILHIIIIVITFFILIIPNCVHIYKTDMYSNQSSQQDTGQFYENMHFNMYFPTTQQPFVYDTNYSRNMHYNVYPSHVTCDNSTANNAMSIDRIRARQEDEKAIEQFLQQTKSQVPIKSKRKDQFKIATIKDTLISVVMLNKKLETVCTELKNNVNLPEVEWQEKISACNVTKHEICKILKTLKETDFLNKIKQSLKKREKKRVRERLRRKKWKKEKLMKEERRTGMHAEADLWIRKEQAMIEQEKQDRNLHKEADMILSDVCSKRSDTRKYLGILQELQNLRKIKMNIARARGENLSSATDEAFNNAISNILLLYIFFHFYNKMINFVKLEFCILYIIEFSNVYIYNKLKVTFTK